MRAIALVAKFFAALPIRSGIARLCRRADSSGDGGGVGRQPSFDLLFALRGAEPRFGRSHVQLR